MKELMQHLLDGGKLVDERNFTIQFSDTKEEILLKDRTGHTNEVWKGIELLVDHLASYTVEKLETYEDGFYWVMCEESSMERRLWFCQNRNWFQISHKNVIPSSQNPHRVIERVEL